MIDLSQLEWFNLLEHHYGSKWHIDVMHNICNWPERRIEISLRVGNYEQGYAHIFLGQHHDFTAPEQVVRDIQRQLDWYAERGMLTTLSSKERKLRQALAIAFTCSTSAEKVKERAAKLMTMSDMGLMMMLSNMGVKQSTIQEIINSK